MTESSAPRHRIGVDLGGTKIEAVVLASVAVGGGSATATAAAAAAAAAAPRELARARIATNRDLGYEHVVNETCSLVLTVAKQAGVDIATTLIGVGMPGSITMRTSDGSRSDVPLIKNSNTTCLNGRPFRSDLAKALGRLGPTDAIAFANDANCFALAEATWGAARGARVAFGVIMGTGVGGGLVLAHTHEDGSGSGVPRAWDGAQGIAGEWGHVVLDPDEGLPCYCGRRGCIETYLSGPAIEREYAKRSGTPRSLSEIAARSEVDTSVTSGEGDTRDDMVARELIAERVEIFGRALAIVINVVDPDVIVLGGGVSNLRAFYEEGPRAVARWVFNDDLATRIVKHTLGDSAGVLGAALLPT